MKNTPKAQGLVILLVSLSLSTAVKANNRDANAETNIAALEQEAKQRIQVFAKQLKSTLKAAITEGGLTTGVDACFLKAPLISKNNSEQPWSLTRTSLKVRNTSNTADEWELEQLKTFEQQKTQGKSIKMLNSSTLITNQDGSKKFRFAKAIPTQQICLACHGEQIPNSVKESIASHYPDDKAVGFKLGDIRGIFSVSKNIK